MDKQLPFACIECGASFDTRLGLERHWAATGDGPRQQQADAIDRARWSVMGDAAPTPLRVREDDVPEEP
jgi:hypothetical protein